jgi:ankyrin repeat protein
LDLWEWKTWEVVAHLVKPLTEEGSFEQRRRCRFADVAQVKPFTGPASVFMSHCWGGKWGDLVAAACQGARRDRRVWIDVFAVRQWPGNSKDLDFRGVISGVQGVIVASPPLHGGKVAEAFFYNDALRAEYLSSAEYLEASRVLPFCRLWCIVEFYAALASGKPLIFKCGTTQLQTGGGSVKVVSGDAAVEMLENFSRMVDVATAECAVPADKEQEMALIDAATVNSMVSKAMTLGMVAVAADVFEVDAHLCGEPEALAAKLSEERTFAVLQVACSAGLLDVVANLLDRCGDGGGGGGGGRSLLEGEYYPLFIAASLSHVKVVQMLVDKGADVNQANTDGDTPLKIAAQQGHLEVVGFLVDKGANVNYADKDGVTPLKISAQKGHVGVVNLLLDKGAEVNHADVDGVTSLFMAAQEGHVEVVGLLVDKGANFDQTGNDGDFPLKIAAQQGHMEVVGLLVDKGANVNHADTSGVTPLFMAAQKGHVDAVALLVDKGANVNHANNDGVTPVSIAAQGGYTEVVALLSNKGAHLGAHGAAGLLVAVDF